MARYHCSVSRFGCRPTAPENRGGSSRPVLALEPSTTSSIPMSLSEALAIYQAMGPGALHRLHEAGIHDSVALRVAEVIQTATY